MGTKVATRYGTTVAECAACDWRFFTSGKQPAGANTRANQHADRNPGHVVTVQSTKIAVFGSAEP